MGKSFLTVFVLGIITAALSFAASFCEVKNGAYRGWVQDGDAVYYYDDFGDQFVGFNVMPEDGTTRYFDEETHILATGETLISGNKYLFDGEGIMLTGFQKVDGKTRYYSPGTGVMKTGWFNDNSADYYFDEKSGDMATGWMEIEGKKYYFEPESGKLTKGLFTGEDGTFYADPDTGVLNTGLQAIDGKHYYFDEETGVMKKGWVDIGEDRYFFNEDTGEGLDGIIEKEDGKYGFTAGLMIRNKRAMDEDHIYYFGEDGKVTREIDGNKKMVAITYDDGPSIYTNTIIDVFEKYNQKCTFFIVGDRISWNQKPAKRYCDLGYELGNHTYSHNVLTKLSIEKQREKLKGTDDALMKLAGRKTTCIRPPEGRWNNDTKKAAELPIILWSVDSRDWESRNATKIYNRIVGHVKDGDIILMHDLYESTANATKKVVPALIDAGFQLVTVEEMGLLKRGGLEPSVVYYSIEKKK